MPRKLSIDEEIVAMGGAENPEAPPELGADQPIHRLRILPVFQPRVLDHSTIESHARCPRKAFYSYFLRRGPVGTNYPIGWGLVYHKYREVLDMRWLALLADGAKREQLLQFEVMALIHKEAVETSTEGWEDPPLGHKKDWMTFERLMDTLDLAFKRWQEEKRQGEIEVLFTEQAFELLLPSGRPYGGRIDQIVRWNGKLWLRDFKTTSRMGATFSEQFEPNNQFTGYTWASQTISLRDVEGVIVEVPYNTKTKGPEIHQFLSTRSKGHLQQWIASIEDEMDQIELHTRRMMERDPKVDGGILAWPMRTTSCSDFGGCYYRRACQQETPYMIEKWLEANTRYSHWDFTNPDAEEEFTE